MNLRYIDNKRERELRFERGKGIIRIFDKIFLWLSHQEDIIGVCV